MPNELVEERKRRYVGKRVRFVCHGDGFEPHPLTPGEQGSCTGVDDLGTLFVKWDSGRRLGILVEDAVEIVG